MSPGLSKQGLLVAVHGRQYDVRLADGRVVSAYPKGKKSIYACGDEVTVSADGGLGGHAPRRSLLYRSDAYRQKLIAANVTQLVLVVATEPSFSDMLLSRALVAAEHEGLAALIVLNKCDLSGALPAARAQLAPYAALGYRVVELSAKRDADALRPLLAGETSVLVGQSGMGKSTLTNALIPEAQAPTREISEALDSGKHTTTHATLYALPEGGALIDSPGLQEFGLAHLTLGEIEFGFRELRPFLGQCRFRDCRHDAEPGCAVKDAVAAGTVSARRLEHFHQLVREIPQN